MLKFEKVEIIGMDIKSFLVTNNNVHVADITQYGDLLRNRLTLDKDHEEKLIAIANLVASYGIDCVDGMLNRDSLTPPTNQNHASTHHTPTNPSHYKFTLDGKEYDIDQVIVALGLPWRLANAMKYIARAGKKDDEKQDISKAITYLQRHIQ